MCDSQISYLKGSLFFKVLCRIVFRGEPSSRTPRIYISQLSRRNSRGGYLDKITRGVRITGSGIVLKTYCRINTYRESDVTVKASPVAGNLSLRRRHVG